MAAARRGKPGVGRRWTVALEAPAHLPGDRDQQSSSESISSAVARVRRTHRPLGAQELRALPFLARVEVQTSLY